MFHQLGPLRLHFIAPPATDDRRRIVFTDLPDQVAAMQITGGFSGYDIIFHVALVEDFQHQDADTIDQGNNKNTFCCFIPVGIYIQREQDRIGQQTH